MLLSADRGVGPWLASFVEALPEGPNVRWQDYVLEVALPEPGSHGMGVSQGAPRSIMTFTYTIVGLRCHWWRLRPRDQVRDDQVHFC